MATNEPKSISRQSFLNFLKTIPLKGANVPGDEDGKFALIDEKY
jgi:hypothetical protein